MKGKELYRSKENKIVGGVCGGIGEFLETSPTIIRLICALMVILSPWIGITGYLLAWIIIPEKHSSKKRVKK
ncbi:MAG: PspC domain-containing protein [Nanoarchaeota archaeon]|nr:PspC domain-containing protein [Nanoarchaeota archaeon]MBU1501456.1 PspC domain-containing protein [Nanoarchaeota archaeon]MBU2459122.1 PspC domain-containing protein [Nanoarchaeota archaeon]